MGNGQKPLRYTVIRDDGKTQIGDPVKLGNHDYRAVGFLNHAYRKIQLELDDPEGVVEARFDD